MPTSHGPGCELFSLGSIVPFSGPLAQATLEGDLHLAFGSFGLLGNHFCHGLPEPNTLPWGSFPALFSYRPGSVPTAPCLLLSTLSSTPPASWWSEVLQGR